MCNQAVSLVAAECERQGITSVVIQFLREIAEKVRPPRALLVPFPHGYPLGKPNEAGLQTKVINAGLDLLENSALQPPALVEFRG